MLSSLHVENYALIDSLDIDFPKGLVIVSGQTGAGKSIMLGALALALGEKADASGVSAKGASARPCVVEARFEINPDDLSIRTILEENDLDFSDGEIILRRVISPNGRSRCFLNDSPVTISVLSALKDRLIDIHSQHQSLLLKDGKFQLSLLDAFAHNASRLEKLRECLRALKESSLKRDRAIERLQEARAKASENASDLQILRSASLQDENEIQTLEERHAALSNVEAIKEQLEAISTLESSAEGLSICGSLKEISKRLEKLSSFIPSAGPLSGRVRQARIELEDVFDEISSLERATEFSPSELENTESRLSQLYSLLKKFHLDSIAELIAKRDSLALVVEGTESLEEEVEDCLRQVAEARAAFDEACADLTKARKEASADFEESITGALRFLEMPLAVFKLSFVPIDRPDECGAEGVRFLFSSIGAEPEDLSRCASGGELSRIMLCLKDIKARYEEMPTMIFDEIDSGVSGSVADKMGSMICSMGERMQILAITHLPQVASKGKSHILVSKDSADPLARTKVSILDTQGRVHEIARMLSGSSLTPQAIENAKALLGL